MNDLPSFVGMVVTGLLPIVAIGAGLAALVSARQKRTQVATLWSIVALVAFGASAWVYVFVLSTS